VPCDYQKPIENKTISIIIITEEVIVVSLGQKKKNASC